MTTHSQVALHVQPITDYIHCQVALHVQPITDYTHCQVVLHVQPITDHWGDWRPPLTVWSHHRSRYLSPMRSFVTVGAPLIGNESRKTLTWHFTEMQIQWEHWWYFLHFHTTFHSDILTLKPWKANKVLTGWKCQNSVTARKTYIYYRWGKYHLKNSQQSNLVKCLGKLQASTVYTYSSSLTSTNPPSRSITPPISATPANSSPQWPWLLTFRWALWPSQGHRLIQRMVPQQLSKKLWPWGTHPYYWYRVKKKEEAKALFCQLPTLCQALGKCSNTWVALPLWKTWIKTSHFCHNKYSQTITYIQALLI